MGKSGDLLVGLHAAARVAIKYFVILLVFPLLRGIVGDVRRVCDCSLKLNEWRVAEESRK